MRYRSALSGIPDLLLPHYDDPRQDHIYQNYTIRSKQGNDFSDYLKSSGVEVLTQFSVQETLLQTCGSETGGPGMSRNGGIEQRSLFPTDECGN